MAVEALGRDGERRAQLLDEEGNAVLLQHPTVVDQLQVGDGHFALLLEALSKGRDARGELLGVAAVAVEGADDHGRFVTTDANGNPIIVGRTLSSQFPTTPGAYDGSFAGSEDLFCTKFEVSWAPTRPRRSHN